ncbi:HlyD family type I secretion periplasmic adaptor subunit [Pseudomonas aeruginosa]|uniref:HlyD family type I secretion periplasmic adaptor subunit n=1 Tax=Pseudomonas aeruginosa TaxID=287 RepID=UPI0034D232ED
MKVLLLPDGSLDAAGSERDARYFVRLGWALVLLFGGGFMLWAALAPLDQGIPVQGTVVVSGKRKAVQPLGGGIVKQILVHEGQKVSRGEPLFRLDKTQLQADVESLSAQLLMSWATLARWESERDELEEVRFPEGLLTQGRSGIQTVLDSQRQLFRSRRQALASEEAAIRANIAGATDQLSGLLRSRNDLEAQVNSLEEQLANLGPLATNGYIPRNRLLEYQRQLSQVRSELAQNAGESGRIEKSITESRLKLQQRAEEYQKEVRGQLAEAQLKTETLRQQLTSSRYELTQSEILAPSSGIAANLAVHTEGAVIKPGETLLEIVPQDAPLEVEGHLPVNLIDKVRRELPVDILFTAFNQSRTPRVVGEVSLISADQLVDEKTGAPYFVLRSTVTPASLERLGGLSIRPGMPAEMFVRTGERSLLNYLFKPLLDRAGTALTED